MSKAITLTEMESLLNPPPLVPLLARTRGSEDTALLKPVCAECWGLDFHVQPWRISPTPTSSFSSLPLCWNPCQAGAWSALAQPCPARREEHQRGHTGQDKTSLKGGAASAPRPPPSPRASQTTAQTPTSPTQTPSSQCPGQT